MRAERKWKAAEVVKRTFKSEVIAQRNRKRKKRTEIYGTVEDTSEEMKDFEKLEENGADWEIILSPTTTDIELESYLHSIYEVLQRRYLLIEELKARLGAERRTLANVLATLDKQIKLYYRKNALMYHPDRSESKYSTQLFQVLTKAYTVLSDPVKRKEYTETANHTLYLLAHENDEDLKMTDLSTRDALQKKRNARASVLAITSGLPNCLQKPKIERVGSGKKKGGILAYISWNGSTEDKSTRFVAQAQKNREKLKTIYLGKNSGVEYFLKDDYEYSFRVRAQNAVGAGEWSVFTYVSVIDGQVCYPYEGSATNEGHSRKNKDVNIQRNKKRYRRKKFHQETQEISEQEQILLKNKEMSQSLFRAIKKKNQANVFTSLV
eukprot:CAMPEP_0174271010 /NCGR_PEP_ID=MMETSP0439-20130205/46459_1 /TAXON_ID=0 /ORGANISM="Stereomyxa ramosa, Strain Chinc5" /LENGTH=379 /DNA_ID=CAMNT_0015360727 /DNA_START=273 /DNA_END=1409 /DNA_ORIENTATION=+